MTLASSNPTGGNQPDLSGRRLGDFQILRRLGRGAMAEVYLAEQASLRRQVAIKVLKQELARDAAYVERFRHEARAVASLTHANIVQIHDVGEADGIHYIAQEYVSGRNLGQLIERSGSINVQLAVAIMRQVAAALHRAAEQGIVHRDIKPENIMLSRSGEVKVADFGLARVQGGDGLHLTQVGMTIGTPLYMAPEQIEGKPLDGRADLYSFGVTCYHMLVGYPPFRGETALAVAVQHINTPPTPLAQLRPDMPAGLCRIVHRLMAKQPADRYPSARELLQDLRGLQIEGAGNAWASDLDWSTAEMVAVGDGPLTDRSPKATQQLQTLMNAGARSRTSQPKIRWFIAACAAALGVGVLAAVLSRPDPLLAGAQSQTIPQRESAWRQLYHAKMVDTEAAWQSVEKYFPQNRFAVPLAKQGLVRYYLWQSFDYQKALPLLDELAASNETETSLRAFAIAGRCVALSMLGQQDAARDEFNRLTSDMIDDLDPRMRRTLESLMARNRAALSREASENLRRLQQQVREAPEG